MRYSQKCKGGKCRSGKCGSVKIMNRYSRGGKCRSRIAEWKAEPMLYIEKPLSYFLKMFSDS